MTASLSAEVLLDRWRRLPAVEPVGLREDIDRTLDSSLGAAEARWRQAKAGPTIDDR